MKGNEKLPAGQPGGRPLPGEGAFGLPAGHPGCWVPGVSTLGAGYANAVMCQYVPVWAQLHMHLHLPTHITMNLVSSPLCNGDSMTLGELSPV